MIDYPAATPSASPVVAGVYAYYTYYLHHPVARRAELEACTLQRRAQVRIYLQGSPEPIVGDAEVQRCAAAARAQARVAPSLKDNRP